MTQSMDKPKNYDNCPIDPKWFFKNDSDKTKFSWFHYEYACEMFILVTKSRTNMLRKWKTGRNEKEIAWFCAYYAKRMRDCMFEVFEGHSSKVDCRMDYVWEYCHHNTENESRELALLARDAILGLLDICGDCSQRCYSESGEYCSFFD
jgi:hypothetical protein